MWEGRRRRATVWRGRYLLEIAADAGEEVPLRRSLDAFGDDFGTQAVGGATMPVTMDTASESSGVLDEGAVDLEVVDGESFEVGEGTNSRCRNRRWRRITRGYAGAGAVSTGSWDRSMRTDSVISRMRFRRQGPHRAGAAATRSGSSGCCN